MIKQIFVNLPVKDLQKSIKFFTHLGFTFNKQFTDENATCMIIGENIFAMLIVEKYFKTFTKKPIADAKKSTETILALAVENKEKVNEIVHKAKTAGAVIPELKDYGWMSQWGFHDLDDHQWEIFHMDESKMPKEMKDKK